MSTRRCILALLSVVGASACDAPTDATRSTALTPVGAASASFLANTLPITNATGVTNDGWLTYVSSGGGGDLYEVVTPNMGFPQSVVPLFATSNARALTAFNSRLVLVEGSAIVTREVDGTIVSQFTPAFLPGSIANDGTNLFIASAVSTQITVTDAAGAPIGTFDPGVASVGMAFYAASGTLWLNGQDGKLHEFTTGGQALQTCVLPVSGGPLRGLAIRADSFVVLQPGDLSTIPNTSELYRIDPAELVCTPATTTVNMEVLSSSPGGINTKGGGNIRVVIVTDAAFDAATVDVSTVRFGRTGTEAAASMSQLADVDGDGDADLTLRFKLKSTGIACGDGMAFLTGKTLAGETIQGSDGIQTRPCK